VTGFIFQFVCVLVGVVLLLNFLIAMMNSIYEEIENSSTEEYRYLKTKQLTQMEYTPWPIPFNMSQAFIGCLLGAAGCCCDFDIPNNDYYNDYTSDRHLKNILYSNMVVGYFRETLTESKYKKALRMFDNYIIPIDSSSPTVVLETSASTNQREAHSSSDDDTQKTLPVGRVFWVLAPRK